MPQKFLFNDSFGNAIYEGDMVEWRMHDPKGEYYDEGYIELNYVMMDGEYRIKSKNDKFKKFYVFDPYINTAQIARDYELRKIYLDRLTPADVSFTNKLKEEIGV